MVSRASWIGIGRTIGVDRNLPMFRKKVHRFSEETKARLIEVLADSLKAQNNVIFAYLYGSFAEGLPFHDIDIGIYVDTMEGRSNVDFALTLGGLLSERLRVPVDIRVLNRAPTPFMYHALRGRLLVDKDVDLRCQIVERTVGAYLDIKPLMRQATKEAFVK